MMRALITIDTELSAGLHQAQSSPADNFARSILGRCGGGDYGIHFFMDRLEEHGHIGVFFVDPMPALVYGTGVIADIVSPIVERGHEVQLHIHTEWLEFVEVSPLGEAQGRNIGDFAYEDQAVLIELARDLFVEAGAPDPIAFRAGNYGANDATLRVLARLGISYDSSFNPSYVDHVCDISLPPDRITMVPHLGVTEVPIAAINDGLGGLRPAQLCALSGREMLSALGHAAKVGAPHFTVVSHSFELLSRDRRRPNRTVVRRLEALCRHLAAHGDIYAAGFEGLIPCHTEDVPLLEPNIPRTLERVAEQAMATLIYDRLRTV